MRLRDTRVDERAQHSRILDAGRRFDAGRHVDRRTAGRVAIASPTFSGVRPPARTTGRRAATRAARAQSIGASRCRRAAPGSCASSSRSTRCRPRRRSESLASVHALARPDRDSADAAAGVSRPCSLHAPRRRPRPPRAMSSTGWIDEHADRRHEWRQRGRDRRALATGRCTRGLLGQKMKPTADAPSGRASLRILAASDAADLDRGHVRVACGSMAASLDAIDSARECRAGIGLVMNRSPIRNAR